MVDSTDRTDSTTRVTLPLTDKPGIQADDPMSEAGRKVMGHYAARMLNHEQQVRTDSSKEAVHDMRVATRRLRSILRMFEPYYKRGTVKSFSRSLRDIAEILGAVRDLEVMMAKANVPELQPVLDTWATEHGQRRTELLELLDSADYAEFVREFVEFVSTPYLDARLQSDEPRPYFVRHLAATMIYERYSQVRAYETALSNATVNTLHALRIDGKRFRYTLEAFAEVLQPEAKVVIDAIKTLQEYLGNLQDERVIMDCIYEYLQHVQTVGDQQPVAPILQHLVVREEEKQRLLSAVSEQWAAFTAPKVRKALATAVSAL